MRILTSFCLLLLFFSVNAQSDFKAQIISSGEKIPYAKVKIKELNLPAISDDFGTINFSKLKHGDYTLIVRSIGFEEMEFPFSHPSENITFSIKKIQEVDEVVVSGTMKEVSKKESTVNVEVFTAKFFKKNPSNSVYEAVQNVNGIRPQLNCAVCSTGDIHINGLEGPYTMVLIDGMPIVSNLATVYGLSGIPTSMIERMEVVKGPASALYGSEAIGGVINIITVKPSSAPVISADVFTTSWLETSADVAIKARVGKFADVLTGINYYNYEWKQDQNNDGFTDITLEDRVSIFQKWNFKRKNQRLFSIAGRYLYEDRWGGEMDWNADFRGSDSIYGESIYTSRWELMGAYQLPFKEKLFLSFSINDHNQNSQYANTSFQAKQFAGFGQLHWDKKLGRHDMVIGTATRFVNYDDNTPATATNDSINPSNMPAITWLPGVFVQDEIRLNDKNKLLMGVRYDYHTKHGSIFTPRAGYKWTMKKNNVLRFNVGTGYRVVNIFTEDHAALLGSREVIISEEIDPETSYSGNLNFTNTMVTKKNKLIGLDISLFYTYFNNRIVADYDTDPNKIIYANLTSHGVSQGLTVNTRFKIIRNLDINAGFTLMDVSTFEEGVREQQILTEKMSGKWSVSYKLLKNKLSIDYTGNLYSPMRLPLLGELDPRPEYSPWWSIQNIQLTYSGFKNWEIYGGVKNLLNWTPTKLTNDLIARAHDPFDKLVQFDADGNALATAENPYAMTFDPTYVFAPNQGIKGFVGVRYSLNKIRKK